MVEIIQVRVMDWHKIRKIRNQSQMIIRTKIKIKNNYKFFHLALIRTKIIMKMIKIHPVSKLNKKRTKKRKIRKKMQNLNKMQLNKISNNSQKLKRLIRITI